MATNGAVAKQGRSAAAAAAATVLHLHSSAKQQNIMSQKREFSSLDYPVISKQDFGKFKEYSVIHTDRSLNLMSDPFQRVMRDLNELLKVTYNAEKVAIIPGYDTIRYVTYHHSFSSSPRLSLEFLIPCASSCYIHVIFVLQFRDVWYGSRGATICDERARHGDSQRMVQLSMDGDF
jgi:hypothetical protein